jgi:hypothetical protein
MPLFLDGRIAAGGAIRRLVDGSGAEWQCRRCGVQWSGGMFSGTGDRVEDPVVIVGAGCTAVGIRAEKQYLTRRFGWPAKLATEGRGWKLLSQRLIEALGRPLDALEIELATGGRTTVFFDVTDFFGKTP